MRRQFKPTVFVAGVLILAAATAAARQETSGFSEPPFMVLAVLRRSDAVPLTMVPALRSEVERIWRLYGIRFSWRDRLPSEARRLSDLAVVIHMTDHTFERRVGAAAPGAVGAVLRAPDSLMRRVIFVSPRGAERVVRSAGAAVLTRPVYERLFARFVGRVIGHELGHLLLNTPTHGARGLMRARFSRRDVVSDQEADFRLEETETMALSRAFPDTIGRAVRMTLAGGRLR